MLVVRATERRLLMDNFRRIGLEKITEDKIPSSAIPISLTNTDTISGNVLYVPLFRNNVSHRPSGSLNYYFPAHGTAGSLTYFGITCEGSQVSIESGDFSMEWPSSRINFGGSYMNDYYAPCISYGAYSFTNDTVTLGTGSNSTVKIFPLDLLPFLLKSTSTYNGSYTYNSTTLTLSLWRGDNDYYVKLKFSAPFTFTGSDNYGTTWPHPPYVDTES